MKKTIKRLGAIFLAMAMAVSVLCTGALAADTTYTLTINDTNKNHKYVAYQVFAGTVSANGKTLSDIQWGTGVDTASKKSTEGTADSNGKTLVEAIRAITVGEDKPFASKTTAAEIAEVLGATANNSKDSDVAKAFAAVVANYVTGDGHTSGDWVDVSGEVAAHYTISGLTAGYYFVKSNNDANATDVANTRYILSVVGNATVDTKSAVPTVDKKVNGKKTDTAQIGEKVTFTLTGTLPDNYDDYTTYKYVFHDTLSSGLTLDKDSIKVYKNSVAEGNLISNDDSNTYYTVKPTTNTTLTDSCTFEVEFANLKDVTSNKTDTIIVQYTATLNKSAAVKGNDNKVKLEYSNDPNKEGTGTTTEKEVKVYTFQMNVEKIANDASKTKLKDAKFVLGTKDNLDLGTIDDNGVPTNTTDLIPVIAGSAPLYTVNDNLTSNDTKQHVMSTDENGALNIVGLKPGTYYLYETKAPNGYNRLTKPVKIEIAVTKEGTLTAPPTIETTVDGNTTGEITTTDGVIKTVQIVNNAGSTLPSTGGMGTKLFYTIGGILMAGAAIVLVVRKRRSDAE